MNYDIIMHDNKGEYIVALTPDNLFSCNMVLHNAPISEELAYDVLTCTFKHDDSSFYEYKVRNSSTGRFDTFATKDNKSFTVRAKRSLLHATYGTLVQFRVYDPIPEPRNFYLEKLERIGPDTYSLRAVSIIGILANQQHYGGVYTGQLFTDVVARLFSQVGNVYFSDELSNLRIRGWLPIASKRDNLNQLLFAYGVTYSFNTSDGSIKFVYNHWGNNVTQIPDDRIYINSSVKYADITTTVNLTEHDYAALASDITVTLFDNTKDGDVAQDTFVAFKDGPAHNLQAEQGLRIIEYGDNYAIVSGVGVLTGQQYTHTTKVLTYGATDAANDSVVTIDSATLVNSINSYNVAQRLLEYYSSGRTVNADIVVGSEVPGRVVRFKDAFGDVTTACISEMNITPSSFMKASCTMIADYTPGFFGNNYDKVDILTGSGDYTFNGPVRLVLIGGGHGGEPGQDGERGHSDRAGLVSGDGTGGVGGNGGEAGYVASYELTLSGSYSYSCGAGGASGQPGTHTHFGQLSTVNGAPSSSGVVNALTNDVYATVGPHGLGGQAGRTKDYDGMTIEYLGVVYTPGMNATYSYHRGDNWARPGFGGGPAAGSNGGAGWDATQIKPNGVNIIGIAGGTGGAGGNAEIPPKNSIPGSGGYGGNGGGGGGSGGALERGSTDPGEASHAGNGGDPGKGSLGGTGGDGIILVYHK